MTSMEPKLDRGIVLLDFRLVRNCKRGWAPTFQKYVSWITLALLLCHKMTHILELRILRKKTSKHLGLLSLLRPE